MKPLFQAVLFLGLVTPSFSAAPSIDFDGKDKHSRNVSLTLGENTDISKTNPIPEATAVISPSGENSAGIISKTAFEITEAGEKIVEPFAVTNGKGSYEFMPNSVNSWEFKCGNQNSPPGKWSVCWSYSYRPALAEHNHTPTGTLAYINPQTGKPLPTQICKSDIPVNTPYTINFKAPVYSSFVVEKSEFYGACSGVINDDVSLRVTVKNLIQLAELSAEPYYDFKESEDQQAHPGNFYATPDTNAKMKKIAWEYNQQFNENLMINDIGLIWGGRYQTISPYNCWTDGQYHLFHRYGRQVDIRSLGMAAEKRQCLEEIACKYQVKPILEGKYPGSLLGQDYSGYSSSELDALDRVEHYHFNFARPTDMVVNPKDDARGTCPDPVVTASVCPKKLGLITFP